MPVIESDGRRRSRRRRSIGGVSQSTSTEGMSLNDADLEEDEEEGVDPAELNRRVRELESAGAPEDDYEFSPRMRMEEVVASDEGSGYSKEYRLELLHRLLMRRIPLDKIAQQLDVSVRTVHRDRQELQSRLRTAAKKLDIDVLIGDTMNYYDEVGAMAMRMASLKTTPINSRIASMRTALGAKNDMMRFLNVAGVFDALKFTPEETTGESEIEKLVEATTKLLGDLDDAQDLGEEDEMDLEEMIKIPSDL